MAGAAPVSARVADLPTLALPDGCGLLVVDQFEEAAALEPEARAAAFDALASLAGRVTCVVAITAAAFGFAMRDERLAASLAAPVLVGPLTQDEYARIIEEPAARQGPPNVLRMNKAPSLRSSRRAPGVA